MTLKLFVKSFCFMLFGLAGLGAMSSSADDWAAESDPHRLVQLTTDRVLEVIRAGRDYYSTDPERFYSEVEGVLGQVVDFDNFARSVMGKYASRQRYEMLRTDAEREAFRTRVERFSERFRRGLVETYAQGLLQFDDQRIEVVPPRAGEVTGSSARVLQHIYGDAGGKPYTVQYTLRRGRDGNWKLRNVIIEGINIGATYRNQFGAAVESNGGDIDAAIAGWNVQPQLDGAGAEPASGDA